MKKKGLITRPVMYVEAAMAKGIDFYDYENRVHVEWGLANLTSDQNIYECDKKIGRGKYSQVFNASNIINQQKCVIKVLKRSNKQQPVKNKKIFRQLKILQHLYGGPNIIKLLDIIKDNSTGIVCFIFQHVNNCNYKEMIYHFTSYDCKWIIFKILEVIKNQKGIEFAHSIGIMHRDIKPGNVMIDYKEKKVRIIDWGLAQFYLPDKDYNVRVSSRYFKGPELLIGLQYYYYSLDIWSLGVMFAGMIFRKDPFFKGENNQDQLYQITKVLGTRQLYQYVKNYNIKLDDIFDEILQFHQKVSFYEFVSNENKEVATPQAISLLQKMLLYDHRKRITPKEAMRHPYFKQFVKQQK